MAADVETQSRSPIVVLGTSGHAREICHIASGAGVTLLGCIGPKKLDEIKNMPVPWLGTDKWLESPMRDLRILIGIGSGKVREKVDAQASGYAVRSLTLVSEAAIIGERCHLASGTVLWPGAILTTDVSLGRHVHIGVKASVSHDSVIADYATLLPAATVAGGCRVGHGATIGAGATVINDVSIGRNSIIGAGAVVTRDIPDNVVAIGVPARVTRKNND